MSEPNKSKQSIYNKRYRERHKTEQNKYLNTKNKARRKRLNRILVQRAKERSCVDCGINWLPTEVMHLDHVRGPVAFYPSGKLHTTTNHMIAEIAKCDTRCPNCHAIRHFEDRHKEKSVHAV